MTVEIISRSISTIVWDRAGIKLATPGIAVRHASVAIHVTDCTTQPRAGLLNSEHDQEIPQSQTADNPKAPRGRAAQPSQDTMKTN